ncbi:single-stranded-DNA-specific exonuclease RecJ [Verrucomicrobiota bacterium]
MQAKESNSSKHSVRHWQTVPVNEQRAEQLAAELNISLPIAVVLSSRGFENAADAERFLNPRLSNLSDPFDLQGMDSAVSRIWQAVESGEKITVFGDYDADGVTGTALLVSVLRVIGGNVTFFLPNRVTDGYGLRTEPLNRCIDIHKPDLIVTVDCGTCSSDAIRSISNTNVDVVVTDHHEIAGEKAPAFSVVNPKLDDNSDTTCLAGVGVAFKLCHALIKRGMKEERKEIGTIDLRDFLDLVAIGTVADVVPLLGENRILVKCGLMRINKAGYASESSGDVTGKKVGLDAVIKTAGISGKIDSYHIGFMIGPRVNAAGRLGDADPALELFLTTDSDRARQLASKLEKANRERKRIEEGIVSQALEEIEAYFDDSSDFGIVTGRKGWHTGTVGIAASRICSRYRRPTVVIGFDDHGQGRGSCRSIEGADVVCILEKCSDLLLSFGGHTMAAGLIIEEGRLEAFRKRFNELCAEKLKDCDLGGVYRVDDWITLGEADRRLWDGIEKLGPFGFGNPAPVWGVRNVRVVGCPKLVGSGHLKMIVASGGTQMEAIAFNMGDRQVPDAPFDIIFRLQENTYKGFSRLQLNIKDFRIAQSV